MLDREIGTFPLIQNVYFLLHVAKPNGRIMSTLTRRDQTFMFIWMQSIFLLLIWATSISFFLGYCRNITNFLFWVFGAGPATFVKNDNANYLKLECLFPCKKKSIPNFFFEIMQRCCIQICM